MRRSSPQAGQVDAHCLGLGGGVRRWDDLRMGVVIAAIPYETYPEISIGPLTLRTFGLFVAVGVLVGAWFAARYAEEHGIPRDRTYGLATRMVIGGVIGSRITWVLSHLDDID